MADLKICVRYRFGSRSGLRGWVGFQESYVIFRVGYGKCLCPITRWVGGVKKGQKHAYVIFELSLVKTYNFKRYVINFHSVTFLLRNT